MVVSFYTTPHNTHRIRAVRITIFLVYKHVFKDGGELLGPDGHTRDVVLW
jgi:hypothetical protein